MSVHPWLAGPPPHIKSRPVNLFAIVSRFLSRVMENKKTGWKHLRRSLQGARERLRSARCPRGRKCHISRRRDSYTSATPDPWCGCGAPPRTRAPPCGWRWRVLLLWRWPLSADGKARMGPGWSASAWNEHTRARRQGGRKKAQLLDGYTNEGCNQVYLLASESLLRRSGHPGTAGSCKLDRACMCCARGVPRQLYDIQSHDGSRQTHASAASAATHLLLARHSRRRKLSDNHTAGPLPRRLLDQTW